VRVLVVYESMFGNTHVVADGIAKGLGPGNEVSVTEVGHVTPEMVEKADLVVVGGPTHIHGLSKPSTRTMAADTAVKHPESVTIEPDATGTGLREWLPTLGRSGAMAAAFDTRIDAPAAFTGRASKRIDRQLRRHALRVVVKPESFLVDKENHLEPGEVERAREWGAELGRVAMDALTGR